MHHASGVVPIGLWQEIEVPIATVIALAPDPKQTMQPFGCALFEAIKLSRQTTTEGTRTTTKCQLA